MTSSTTIKRIRSWVGLAVCVSVIVSVWLFALPHFSRGDAYQTRQQLFNDRNIDPSAMFYTELDCLDEALDNTRRLQTSPKPGRGRPPQAGG